MFDTILRGSALTTDWAILLTQMVCHGVVDTRVNRLVVTVVILFCKVRGNVLFLVRSIWVSYPFAVSC